MSGEKNYGENYKGGIQVGQYYRGRIQGENTGGNTVGK